LGKAYTYLRCGGQVFTRWVCRMSLASPLKVFFAEKASLWHIAADQQQLAKKRIRVCVLDSSFNPPTLAHQAMLLNCAKKYPSDCYLLLLSTSNADKGEIVDAKESDDTQALRRPNGPEEGGTLGRLLMMKTLAEDLRQDLPNLAVASTTTALFVDKAKAISGFFAPLSSESMFVVGADTLLRIFDRKYYASVEEMCKQLRAFFAGASFVYANRVGSPDLQGLLSESGLLADEIRALLLEFKEQILSVEISERLQTLSSTQARKLLRGGTSPESLFEVLSPRMSSFISTNKLYAQL